MKKFSVGTDFLMRCLNDLDQTIRPIDEIPKRVRNDRCGVKMQKLTRSEAKYSNTSKKMNQALLELLEYKNCIASGEKSTVRLFEMIRENDTQKYCFIR